MTSLRVKNWERFQHYKTRNPPWIRLYNELLDDYAFGRLQDASKWHAVGMWLLASRLDNRIPDDPLWIAQKINARSGVDLDELLSSGFIERYDGASEVLADCKPRARPAEAEQRKATAARAREGAAAAEHDDDQPGRAVDPDESAITRVVVAANKGLQQALGDACRPILASHGSSRQTIAEWLAAGIPAELCETVVFQRAAAWKPNGHSRRINSMAYFDGAVREAAEKHQANGVEPVTVWDEKTMGPFR